MRAAEKKQDIIVRNPYSTRPYQHVLEPLYAYLMIAQKQYGDISYADWYNVGPDECDCVTTGDLVDIFCSCWGEDVKWKNVAEKNAPHEASFLKLDCSKIKSVFGWKPRRHIKEAVEMTVEWTKAWLAGEDVNKCMEKQINEFLEG